MNTKRSLPTEPQRRVLQAMSDGAALYRYEHPNSSDSWSLSNVPPINATVKVRVQVAVAARCAGWISADGPPVWINSSKRQGWMLTDMGRDALQQLQSSETNEAPMRAVT